MDVTFHETIYFFSPSQLHLYRECRHEEEDEPTIPLPVLPYVFYVDGHSNQGEMEQVVVHKEKELITTSLKKAWTQDFTYVFVRRKKKVVFFPRISCACSTFTLSPSITLIMPHADSHLFIDVQKGVRFCTQHPIANHVCYDSLFHKFRAFFTSLSFISIPCSVSQVP